MGADRIIAREIRRQMESKQEELDETIGYIEDLERLNRDKMDMETLLNHQDELNELKAKADRLQAELESMEDAADMHDTYDDLQPGRF